VTKLPQDLVKELQLEGEEFFAEIDRERSNGHHQPSSARSEKGGEPIYREFPPNNGNLSDLLESPTDLASTDVEGQEWQGVKGLVGKGRVLLLSALPKAGKTTFLLELLRAAKEGRNFIGLDTTPMRILFLSEENKPSLRQALERAGLESADEIRILRKHRLRQAWPELVTQLPAVCWSGRFDVVIIDTILRWWALERKGENDSATILESFEPLAALANQGVAVILVHHLRKADGEEGTQARGSGALAAAVDIIAELRRDSACHPKRRVLTCFSRFDETPENLVIELGEGGYIALGDSASVALDDLIRRVRDALPPPFAEAINRDELAEASGLRRGEVSRAMKAMEGEFDRLGAGKKGDPHRYRRKAEDLS
jgi:predicted ATP-dependent serine protease